MFCIRQPRREFIIVSIVDNKRCFYLGVICLLVNKQRFLDAPYMLAFFSDREMRRYISRLSSGVRSTFLSPEGYRRTDVG
jgi:hypothetical protein